MFKTTHTLFSPEGGNLDRRFRWHCEPTFWNIDSNKITLSIQTNESSDFWQRTHYGFCADNGHFLWTEVDQDLEMSVEVSMMPIHQYDQAGLMVRLSRDCWLKTSLEDEPDTDSRLGCVVTNRGYSDWSTRDVPSTLTDFALRLIRRRADYLVEAHAPGKTWTQLRLAHLDEDNRFAAVQCGVYSCSPKQAGFTATFRNFLLAEHEPGISLR